MKQINSFSDLEHLQLVARRLSEAGIDITRVYQDWIKVTLGCASLGEAAREAYHTICSNYPNYSREECDEKFDNCMKTGRGDVRVATVFQMAKDAGIDTSLPKGRRPKSEKQKEEERKAVFEQVSETLRREFEFRYNTLSERIEVKETEGEWRDFDDRELNGILTKMHSDNVKVSKDNLETYINSGVFSTPYNPVETYVKELKPWNRRTDYIAIVFRHLHLEEGCDKDFLLECFRFWFVCYVGRATGLDIVNQLMLVLAGEKEGTGKTEFILRLLPSALQPYLYSCVQLSSFKDKDESLAMAHNILFFLDEIMLNRSTFNKLKNMVGGAGAKNVTDRAPFAHNAKVRMVHASIAATTNHIDFMPEDLGSRRLLVLPVTGSDNYDDLPIDKAYAQAYYLATHSRRFSTHITPEMIARLKEINGKYVNEDICLAIIPTVLRKPRQGEKAQAVLSGEIIAWMTSRTGMNRDYTSQKVNAAMRKLGFEPKKTNKGNVYIVKRIMFDELTNEGESLAIDVLNPKLPL